MTIAEKLLKDKINFNNGTSIKMYPQTLQPINIENNNQASDDREISESFKIFGQRESSRE